MGFDSRETQEQQIDNNWGDIEQEAHINGINLCQHLQNLSPIPDDENHPVSAGGDYLARKGIPLRDDVRNGIQSAPMCNIYENGEIGATATVWASATRQAVLSYFKGRKQVAKEKKRIESAGTLDAYNPGSAIRPYADSPLRDGDRRVEYPPLERIAGSVDRQPGDSIRKVEYKKDPEFGDRYKGEPPYEIAEGAPIPLRVPEEKESTDQMMIYADGLLITDKLRVSGRYTSEMVMIEAEKHAVRVAMLMGRRAINKAFAAAKQLDTALKAELTDEDLLEIVFSLRPPYEVTSVFGDQSIIKDYAGIDRSKLYTGGGGMQTRGAVIGTDTWGRSTIGRMFYDVEATDLNEGDNTKALLFMDAREVIDIKIREGSDRATDTYNTRNRSHELAWDIEFGETLRVEAPQALFKMARA